MEAISLRFQSARFISETIKCWTTKVDLYKNNGSP